MSHEYILWIATAAYAVHMVEETMYNWQGWVRRGSETAIRVERILCGERLCHRAGVSCAMVGWRQPAAALIFPAFMLVNGILFHITPVLVTRIFSPGLFTAVILFMPIGSWAYYGAWHDGVLSTGTVIISGVIGFLLMMFPIVLQLTKRLPFSSQSETADVPHRPVMAAQAVRP